MSCPAFVRPGARPARIFAWPVFLVLLTLAIYAPAIRYDFVRFDDGPYVAENPRVLSGLTRENVRWAFATVHEQWWLPVLWISYMLDAEFLGPAPHGFHGTNVLLHAANAGLLFWVLVRMTGSPRRSFFVAALFALHPLRVESVAWITARKDVLSGLFFFLALLAHVRQAEHPGPRRRVWIFIWLLLGLMSKGAIVFLPILLLLLDYWPLRRIGPDPQNWRGWRSMFAEKIPLFVLSGAFIILNLGTHASGSGREADLSALHRLALIPGNIFEYLRLAVWPVRLCSFYPENDAVSPGLAAVAALSLAVSIFLCMRWASRRPYWLVGWLWFLVALGPVVRGVRLGMASHADRFTYLPSIGLAVMLVWTAADAVRNRNLCRRWAAVFGAFLLTALAWQTTRQLPTWKDSLSLYRQQVAIRPGNHVAWNNVGRALLERGRPEEALGPFARAMELRPDDSNLAAANYAEALIRMDRSEQAIGFLQSALAQRNPRHPEMNLLLGFAFLNVDRAAEAIPCLRQAVAAAPQQFGWRIELVRALYEADQSEAAQEEIRRLQVLGFSQFRDFDGLASRYAALWRSGEILHAWHFFRNNLRRRPDDAALANNAAWCLATTENPPAPPAEALRLARRAQELAPGPHPGILDTLAAALAANGLFEEAEQTAQQALDLARQGQDGQLAAQISARLETYRQRRPWRE